MSKRQDRIMTRFRADLLLLLAAAIWGLAFIFQKTAMAAMGPLSFIAARSILAAAALAPFAILEARHLGSPAPLIPRGLGRAGLIAGLAFFAGAALQQTGLVTATATNGGFLTALYVVLTPFVVWAIRGKQPGLHLLPAVGLSFVGTWLLGGGAFSALSFGDWLITAGALFWAAHMVLSENGAEFHRPITFTCLQFAAVGAVAIIGAAPTETLSLAALKTAAPEILYVGLLSSALTFTILTLALKHTSASEAAIIVSTESLFAAIAGAWFLGERLTPMAWFGAALIMAAVILVQLGPRRGKSQAANTGL